MQVVGASPNVDEHQRPEVNDTQLVTEHRAFSSLGHEVIHQSQERSGQEERDRVVTIPPLHQRVLDPRVNRVTLTQSNRDYQVIKHVQDRHSDNRRNVKPQSHVHVTLAAVDQGHHEVHTEEQQPNDRNGYIDRPLQFRILLALRYPER